MFKKSQPEGNTAGNDWRNLLGSMTRRAGDRLAKIDQQLNELHAEVIECNIVSFDECKSTILSRLLYERDEAFKSVSGFFGTAATLRGHQNTVAGTTTAAGFHISDCERQNLGSSGLLVLEAAELSLAMLSDADLDAFAEKLTAAYGCQRDTPPSSELAGKQKAALLRIQELHAERPDVEKLLQSAKGTAEKAQSLLA